MEPRTLEALRQSIAHWDRLASGKQRDGEWVSERDCALCGLFFADNCVGCPVMERSKVSSCKNTPFRDAVRAISQFGFNSQAFRDAAMRELKFLRSLLPEEHLTK